MPSRPDLAFGSPLLLALPVAFLAFAMVVIAGNLSLAFVGIVVIAPVLVLNDGAPLVFLMAALPAATLFNNTSAGLGGAKVLAIFTLICLALGVLLGRQTLKFTVCALDVAVLGLFLVALFNIALLSLPATGQLSLLQEYLGNLVLYFVVRVMAYSNERLRLVLASFVAGAMLSAAVGLYRYSNGLIGLEENLHRLVIPNQNINSFASIMLIAAAISFAFAFFDTSFGRRAMWLIAGSLSGLAMVLSFSRGAFVGALCMVLAGAVLTRGLRLRVASLAVLIGGVIVARSSVPATLGLSDYVNRVGSIFSFNYQATSGRNILWSMGWDAFLAHPWLGLGIGNFLQAGYWYPLLFRQNGVPPGFAHTIQAVHNFYLGWAVDTGLAGVFFLALAVLVAFVYLMKVLAASRLHPELGTAAHALLLAFVGYFVFIISSPVQYYQLPYILLGLVGSVGFVAKDMRGARFGFRSTVARPESVLTGRPVPILRRRSLAPAPFGRTE